MIVMKFSFFSSGFCHFLWDGDLQYSDVWEGVEGYGQAVCSTWSLVLPRFGTSWRCLQITSESLVVLRVPGLRWSTIYGLVYMQWQRMAFGLNKFNVSECWKLHVYLCQSPLSMLLRPRTQMSYSRTAYTRLSWFSSSSSEGLVKNYLLKLLRYWRQVKIILWTLQ